MNLGNDASADRVPIPLFSGLGGGRTRSLHVDAAEAPALVAWEEGPKTTFLWGVHKSNTFFFGMDCLKSSKKPLFGFEPHFLRLW